MYAWTGMHEPVCVNRHAWVGMHDVAASVGLEYSARRQLGSNRPSPEHGILVVWAFFFNATMIIAKTSYHVVVR